MSEELNCSDGARMLIERMKTNPEEFRGGGARWAHAVNQMLQVRRGSAENNLMMSRRDMNALFNAFETYVMETALAEYTIKELMEPKPERKNVEVRRAVQTPASLKKEVLKLLELGEQYTRAYEEHHNWGPTR